METSGGGVSFSGVEVPGNGPRPELVVDSSLHGGEAAEEAAEEAPFLIFRLEDSLYGVPALSVRELHPLVALSPLQELAPHVAGMLNLRGTLIPVVDLLARFGHASPPYRLADSLVVLHWAGAEVALLVHEVLAVEKVTSTGIDVPPQHGRRRNLAAPFVAGMARVPQGFAMLLHLPNLLTWQSTPRPEDSQVAEPLAARFTSTYFGPADWLVLQERAAQCGQALLNLQEGAAARVPIAWLSLGGEEFALELDRVREFVMVDHVVPVPCCPDHILGQINLRGDVVTLVDVRSSLRTTLTAPPYFTDQGQVRSHLGNSSEQVVVVVVHHEGQPLGIAIDQVKDVLYLDEPDLVPMDAGLGGTGQQGKFFSGGARQNGRLLPLLNLPLLFSEGELEVIEVV